MGLKSKEPRVRRETSKWKQGRGDDGRRQAQHIRPQAFLLSDLGGLWGPRLEQNNYRVRTL